MAEYTHILRNTNAQDVVHANITHGTSWSLALHYSDFFHLSGLLLFAKDGTEYGTGRKRGELNGRLPQNFHRMLDGSIDEGFPSPIAKVNSPRNARQKKKKKKKKKTRHALTS